VFILPLSVLDGLLPAFNGTDFFVDLPEDQLFKLLSFLAIWIPSEAVFYADLVLGFRTRSVILVLHLLQSS